MRFLCDLNFYFRYFKQKLNITIFQYVGALTEEERSY